MFINTFSMQFDLEISDVTSFGYIFRISDQASEMSDIYNFVFSYNDDRQSYLKFNIEKKENRISHTLNNENLGIGRWLPIKITFYMAGDSVEVCIADEVFVTRNIELPKEITPSIVFGGSMSEEIPSFAIRNLRVWNGDIAYSFPLNEYSGESVHDSTKSVVGVVQNPLWLISESYKWNYVTDYRSGGVAGYNFDGKNNRIIVFNRDSVWSYNLVTEKGEAKTYKDTLPVNMRLGTNFYNPNNNRLYAYEVNNLPPHEHTIAYLDMNRMSWNHQSYNYLNTQRHHHTGYLDTLNNKYIIFGGFGNRKYSDEFASYDMERDQWSALEMSGAHIAPRFFSSLGIVGDGQFLIFGGTGNKDGDQTVGRTCYYDLYQVDIRKQKIIKLWDINLDNPNLVPVRNMVISDDGRYFYTMCYPIDQPNSFLRLYKFSIADGGYEILGDSVPIKSQSILTNANLYYSDKTQNLYCCVQEFDGDSSRIVVYSLMTPAVSVDALHYYDDSRTWFWWGISVLALALALGGGYFVRRRKSPRNKSADQMREESAFYDNINVSSNAVYLFGEFSVYDKNGKDISYMFSKKIKQLFLLILFHSSNDQGGISSSLIYEILWTDKSPKEAKNLRGVTLNHLRKILEDIDGLEIVYDNNRFIIKASDPFYCDYVNYTTLCDWQNGADENLLPEQLIAVVSRGKFLRSVNDSCFDATKSEFEQKMIRLFSAEIARLFDLKRNDQVLRVCSLLFSVDQLNEVALWYEINVLRRTRREEEAKKRYYLFALDYQRIMSDEYKTTYAEIIGRNLDLINS